MRCGNCYWFCSKNYTCMNGKSKPNNSFPSYLKTGSVFPFQEACTLFRSVQISYRTSSTIDGSEYVVGSYTWSS